MLSSKHWYEVQLIQWISSTIARLSVCHYLKFSCLEARNSVKIYNTSALGSAQPKKIIHINWNVGQCGQQFNNHAPLQVIYHRKQNWHPPSTMLECRKTSAHRKEEDNANIRRDEHKKAGKCKIHRQRKGKAKSPGRRIRKGWVNTKEVNYTMKEKELLPEAESERITPILLKAQMSKIEQCLFIFWRLREIWRDCFTDVLNGNSPQVIYVLKTTKRFTTWECKEKDKKMRTQRRFLRKGDYNRWRQIQNQNNWKRIKIGKVSRGKMISLKNHKDHSLYIPFGRRSTWKVSDHRHKVKKREQ